MQLGFGVNLSIFNGGNVIGPSYIGLLDTYSGAAAAYSVRLLKSDYTGNAIRVRRSSDNTEQNIGFDGNGNLNESALTSFCGADNGFVTTWYDQSGNGRNATQTTAVNQPQIVSSGSIIKVNNKSALTFDGVNDIMVTTNFGLVQPENLFLTYQWLTINKGANTFQGLIDGLSGDSMSFRESAGRIQAAANTQFLNTTTGANTNQNISSILYNSTTSNYYLNNTLIVTGNAGILNGGGIQIGRNGNFSNRHGNFNLQELIVYGSNQNTNRSGITGNLNTYYGVY
jgi:hypothetical protein